MNTLIKISFFFLLPLAIGCSSAPSAENTFSNKGRAEYEFERIKDPRTGKIPENIRMKELAFASTLPKTFTKTSARGASLQFFEPIGPRNVAGRTRAITFDKDHPNVVLAGGVSGGMWRSSDFGNTWNRVTNYEDHSAVSCVLQDQRANKANIMYYGAGENIGNSASKSFSASYFGSGMYKSTDYGITWSHLPSTSAFVNKKSEWSYVFNIAQDQTRNDSDIVFAAIEKGIMRSNDGGASWTRVLGSNANAEYTNIVATTTGVFYASFSNDHSNAGFWRSENGIDWVKLTPVGIPNSQSRTLMAIAPSNENVVYFYIETPNIGTSEAAFFKYTYVSGDGTNTGGSWNNRTNTLPHSAGYNLNTQGGYCMSLAVKPDNENVVFLGGTNLFRSSNGFSSSATTRQLGGYDADGYPNFDYYEDNQHPDQQSLAFRPGNPNHLLAGTDGGLHFTTNPMASKVIWASFNNGYQTTQFYGIGIDHQDANEIVVSGYQDNGSWWTNSADTNTDWKFSRGADGSYCAKENGTNTYYFSSQNGNIRRYKLSANGSVLSSVSVNPNGVGGYLFNHPYILDPSNNNRMYLPAGNSLYRNANLAALDNNSKQWTQIATLPVSQNITAIAASESNPGVVYVGTSARKIYRIEDNGTPNAVLTDISTGITSGSYSSCIAVDPHDDKRVIIIYSNYNVISGWYTEDAGNNWVSIEGNLKGEPDAGVPPSLDHIGNGPSFRWARFIPTANGEAILLGTSIGLFATNNLDGTNTEWVQQASDMIGNVVIEQIDHRETDGFCVVSTHGAGAYKTYFKNGNDIVSTQNVVKNEMEVSLFPNPVVNELNIRFSLSGDTPLTLRILNANGQMVHQETIGGILGENTVTTQVNQLPQGSYFLQLLTPQGPIVKPFIK